jgi:glycosyltransferase involved in cell wall biosynthesis
LGIYYSEITLNFLLKQAQLQLARRGRQLIQLLADEGPRGITERVRRTAAERITPTNPVIPISHEDVLNADLSRPFQPAVPEIVPGRPVVVNWVIIPAGPRSGGYTTLFRIIRYLEALGYFNRVYFYNVYRGDHRYYESIVRSSYGFNGCVKKMDGGMEDAHAVVATSWPTAYPVFNSRCAGKRFYFVQDFEPYFYPAGSLSLLAENTYRMGLHAITIGQCFARKLRTEFGMAVDSFEYGCDTSRYRRLHGSKRSGVVFYARPEAARRGVELGLMALEVLAARCPDIEIHIYGTRMGRLPFCFVDHGRVTPDELNRLYNRCYAGLSLSLTNVSLVAYEMLAAGCIPVVNDTVLVRTDLNSSFVRYTPPHPQALAAELESVVKNPLFESLSRAAAASVPSGTWDEAGAKVDAIIRRVLAETSGLRSEANAASG